MDNKDKVLHMVVNVNCLTGKGRFYRRGEVINRDNPEFEHLLEHSVVSADEADAPLLLAVMEESKTSEKTAPKEVAAAKPSKDEPEAKPAPSKRGRKKKVTEDAANDK